MLSITWKTASSPQTDGPPPSPSADNGHKTYSRKPQRRVGGTTAAFSPKNGDFQGGHRIFGQYLL
jgi:hypothetical protein